MRSKLDLPIEAPSWLSVENRTDESAVTGTAYRNSGTAYTYHVGRFSQHIGKSLEQAVPEDVRSFQLHLIEERKVGWSSFNQAVCGLEIGLWRSACKTDPPR